MPVGEKSKLEMNEPFCVSLEFGIARDVTGDYGFSLWLLAGLGVVLVGLCAVLTPARLHRIGQTA